MFRNIKTTYFFVGTLLVVAIFFAVNFYLEQNKTELKLENTGDGLDENNTSQENIIENNFEKENKLVETLRVSEEKLPVKFLISVPFTSQAPFKKWDQIHEEACEEASIIMLKYYLENEKLTPEIAEKEIQKLVAFQNKKYGDYRDTTAQETVELYLDFYGPLKNGKSLKVVYDFEKNDLKKYFSRGFPIIIPAAGRELKNPNFTAPGPLYHNLVLVGYDGDIIITNDPGTRKGGGYKYNIDVLYDAIHDFPGRPEDIEKGRRAMIVVE